MVKRDINTHQATTSQTPLARVYRLKELPGRVGKRLEVPDGRVGVVVTSNGAQRSFPPGRHTILSPLERLAGKGAGLLAGYYSQCPLLVRLPFENLLSADGKMLEASLLGQLQVGDPGRFLMEYVAPRSVLNSNVVVIEDAVLQDALRGFVRDYQAADLIFGLPAEQVVPKLQAILTPALSQTGLELQVLQLFSFRNAEDRVEIARNALALLEQLQDVEFQKQMLLIENQVQLEDFIRQLDADMVETLGLRRVVFPQQPVNGDAPGKSLRAILIEALRTLAGSDPKAEGEARHFLLEDLWKRFVSKPNEEKQELRGRRKPERWWLPRTTWIVFLLLVGGSLTRVLESIGESIPWANRLEVLLGLWSFIIIAILESVKALYERREELHERRWAEPGTTFLDNLTGKKRVRMDQLVRQQCNDDLKIVNQTLNDLRSRLYKGKQIDQALAAKALEEQVARVQEDVNSPNFGRPPYIEDVKVSSQLLDNLLDYDENLLVRASALVEDSKRLLQMHSEGTFAPDKLTIMVERLDAFKTRFAARSNAMRAKPQDMEKYRRIN
jgi:hypothetical protein